MPNSALQTSRQLCRQIRVEYLPLKWLKFTGDPQSVINSTFKVGTMAQATIGLSGLSAQYFRYLISGQSALVHVNARHAVIDFKSEAYHTINNQRDAALWDSLHGMYPAKGDRHVLIHTNFPHHKKGILDILGCKETKAAVIEAFGKWDAFEFENEAARRGMCAVVLRSSQEWEKHPQNEALQSVPPLEIIRRGDAPKRCVAGAKDRDKPLSGVKVLDLTRVLAGPVCGRALADYGADVSWVTSPNLPDLPLLDADTSRGKKSLCLDLSAEEHRSRLEAEVKDCDVFLQAYRPGGLAAKGFGVSDLIKIHPGIICANITAYGYEGPWKNRKGFDSLVQATIGIVHEEGLAAHHLEGTPLRESLRPLPMQALDHATGHLTSLGINIALSKTITEGGSWEVGTSLAAVGQWLKSLGRVDPEISFRKARKLPQSSVPMPQEILDLSKAVTAANGDKVFGIKQAVIFGDPERY